MNVLKCSKGRRKETEEEAERETKGEKKKNMK